ncbi:mCG114630, partial [Mus musculus]
LSPRREASRHRKSSRSAAAERSARTARCQASSCELTRQGPELPVPSPPPPAFFRGTLTPPLPELRGRPSRPPSLSARSWPPPPTPRRDDPLRQRQRQRYVRPDGADGRGRGHRCGGRGRRRAGGEGQRRRVRQPRGASGPAPGRGGRRATGERSSRPVSTASPGTAHRGDRAGERHGSSGGRRLQGRRGRGDRRRWARRGQRGDGRSDPEQAQEQPGEATLLLHRAHHHGHPAEPAEEADPERHLRVHQQPFSVLPGEVPRLAEQHPPQPVAQRLLRQDPPRAGQPGQGQLLDPGPPVRGHVRQRQLPAAPEALQAPPAGAPARADGADDAELRSLQPGGGGGRKTLRPFLFF